MKFRSALATLLTAIILLTALSGCGSAGDKGTNPLDDGQFGDDASISENSSNTTGEDIEDNSGGGLNADNSGGGGKATGSKTTVVKVPDGKDSDLGNTKGFNKTGFPIVDEQVSLTVLTYRSDGNPLNWDNMEFTKQYQKMTNVKINWNLVTASALKDRISLLLASGNYPDIFVSVEGVLNDADVYTYGNGKVFWDMSKSMKDYAPNLYKLAQSDSDIKAAIYQQDGSVYTLPMINQSTPGSYWNINKKWLNTLGLSVPKTTAELTRVLQAFKNSDPDGDGIANQIPFSANCYLPDLFGPWGIYFEWANNVMIDKNGDAQYIFTMNEMQYGMAYWKRLKDQGLAKLQDPQISETEFEQLLSTGKVGCFLWSSPYTCMTEDLFNDYEIMPVPTAPATEIGNNLTAGVKRYSPKVYGNATVIFRSCRNKEVALRWLDYFYSAEGNAFKNYTNVYMKKNASGKYYIDVPKGESHLSQSPGGAIPGNYGDEYVKYFAQSPKTLTSYEKKIQTYNETARNIYAAQKPSKMLRDVTFTAKEVKSLSKLNANLNFDTGWWQCKQMMQGNAQYTGFLGTGWNSWVSRFKKSGVEEFVTIYQAAYDRAVK